jgi:hypothetical protein
MLNSWCGLDDSSLVLLQTLFGNDNVSRNKPLVVPGAAHREDLAQLQPLNLYGSLPHSLTHRAPILAPRIRFVSTRL